jgi:hypothetical protein
VQKFSVALMQSSSKALKVKNMPPFDLRAFGRSMLVMYILLRYFF